MDTIRSLLRKAEGQTLRIRFGQDAILDATISSVSELTGPETGEHSALAMSVIFETDQKNQYYSQANVEIIFEDQTTALIFLVPLGPNKTGNKMRYEAIFN